MMGYYNLRDRKVLNVYVFRHADALEIYTYAMEASPSDPATFTTLFQSCRFQMRRQETYSSSERDTDPQFDIYFTYGFGRHV